MQASIPLLHAAQGVASNAPPLAIWLSLFIVGLAIGAIAAAVSGVRWQSARTRRRVGLRVMTIATAVALLAVILPYDHLLPATHGDVPADVHAAHCHESPAACADAPVTSGPGQLIDGAPLLAEPAMLEVLLLAAIPFLAGVTSRPVLRPPVVLPAASI
jgi:hypothetical protein